MALETRVCLVSVYLSSLFSPFSRPRLRLSFNCANNSGGKGPSQKKYIYSG